MTKQQSLKQRIRARMKKTGERYTTARSHILKIHSQPINRPGLLPHYLQFGGVQTETAILANSFRSLQLSLPSNNCPFTESLILGLCGGLGFMYAVFEYKGHLPILTLTTRSQTMPQNFVIEGLKRCAIDFTISETKSAKVAQKALDQSLEQEKPALCIIDPALLPHYGLPERMVGLCFQFVVVAGQDGDHYWIDDRGAEPKKVSKEDLARARAGCKRAKHYLASLQSQRSEFNLTNALNDAIATTVRALENGEVGVPDSFKINCGFSGLEKWKNLLTDSKSKKGWLKSFPEGERAWAVLQRSYECIQYDYTAPAASRPSYGDFLEEAAKILTRPKLKDAAALFRESGLHWNELANLIANCEDEALSKACDITNTRAAFLDQRSADSKQSMLELWTEKDGLSKECQLTPAQTKTLYGQMAERLSLILETERRAVVFMKD